MMDYQELIDRLLKRLDDFGRGLPTNDYDALVDGRRAAEAIGSLRAFCHTRGIALEQAREEAREWEARCKVLEAELAQVKRERYATIVDMLHLQDDTGDCAEYWAQILVHEEGEEHQ